MLDKTVIISILILNFILILLFIATVGSGYDNASPNKHDIEVLSKTNVYLTNKMILINKPWSEKALIDYVNYEGSQK